jgi:hypothetical protein
MGLYLERITKRVLPKRVTVPLEVVDVANEQWALDSMHDSLYCGRPFRTLTAIAEATRECLAIEVDTSLPASREFLNAYLFEDLPQVSDMAWVWMMDYNEERPHAGLCKLPPAMYRRKLENSSLEVSQ